MPRKRNYGKKPSLDQLRRYEKDSPSNFFQASEGWMQRHADEFTEMVARWKEERRQRNASPIAIEEPSLLPETLQDMAEKEVNDALNMITRILESRMRQKIQQAGSMANTEIDIKSLILTAIKRYGDEKS